MPRPLDLSGRRFGSLVVLSKSHSTRNNGIYWFCRCDCGVSKAVAGGRLNSDEGPRSCGAMLHRVPRTRHGHARNGRQSAMYTTWLEIVERCEKPKHPAYALYGGRGISVCPRWRKDFAAFLADVGPKPSLKHSLDRKDVNGNYSPDNVRWATKVEQARNKRNNLIVLFRGRSMTLAEAVEISGIPYATAYRRIHEGWPIDEALAPGAQKRSRHIGPPTATVAALGRACQAAGISLQDIARIAASRARRTSAASPRAAA